jgi:hypothetical protein
MDFGIAWKLIIAWFGLGLIVMALAGGWSLIVYTVGFAVLFGGFAYRYRSGVKPFFKKHGLNNYAGFLLLSIAVTAGEEIFCHVTGNRIGNPVLAIDLVIVAALWSVWFGTWYFYLSKTYAYEEKEALLLAGIMGVFDELIGTGAFLASPVVLAVLTPMAIVVYAAVFIWPMQLIDFTGRKNSLWKYPASIVIPAVLTIPVAVVLFIIMGLLGLK